MCSRPRVLESLRESVAESVHEEATQRVAVTDAGPLLRGANDHVLDTLRVHVHVHVHAHGVCMCMCMCMSTCHVTRLHGLQLDLEEPLESRGVSREHR